jgi:CRISPR/Cas system-associated exonuclease Cas4 (RecB family)
MRAISKSELLAFRQCRRRLWLETHHPELRIDSSTAKENFERGNAVGMIARELYDPDGQGILIDVAREGFDGALAHSADALNSNVPIFEAGFIGGGGLAFSDVMLPVNSAGSTAWQMIEVKSSTTVKDHHRDEVAIQVFVANEAGIQLATASVAHIDGTFVYPGSGDYEGLFAEVDLTAEANDRRNEVSSWIADAQEVLGQQHEPSIKTGRHCNEPYECGFLDYCKAKEPQADYPVEWLPSIRTKALKQHILDGAVTDMRQVQDLLLSDRQNRVKVQTLSGETFFDQAGAAADLSVHELPVWFLDFETINFAVPIWKGLRPYQQVTFQFSIHTLNQLGDLRHISFLDLSGNDPTERFASELIAACGGSSPIFVYNAGFEMARIKELADRVPHFSQELLALNNRVVDLLPVARRRYYHPSQKGSWSIKSVLPTLAPDLEYKMLEGVQDGGMAMNAYLEAISDDVSLQRKNAIERQLLAYCELDTFAMVRIWNIFSGRNLQLRRV